MTSSPEITLNEVKHKQCLTANVLLHLIHFNTQRYRSRHRRCSLRKGVLRNFAKFTGKHLCQSLFLNEVAG